MRNDWPMNASGLIAKLARIIEEHGDLPIEQSFQYFDEEGILQSINTDMILAPVPQQLIISQYAVGTSWKLLKDDG